MYEDNLNIAGLIRIPFSESELKYNLFNFDLFELSFYDITKLNQLISEAVYAFVFEKLQNS